MSKRYYIAPSILAADFSQLGLNIKEAEAAGADWIHVDIMDGHFVQNMSMGTKAVEACRRVTQLPIDVHLMVWEPEKFVDVYSKAGASHLTVHVESTQNIHRLLQQIQQLGCIPGVALNPGTPVSVIEPVLHMVEIVLVMTVNPGYGGQQFIPETITKIREIRNKINLVNPDAMIEVDGGISASTLPAVIDAGAQVLVAGKAIFNHSDGIDVGIRALRQLLPV